MITQKNYRNNGGGEQFLSSCQVSVAEAVRAMVLGEFDFGGQITLLESTSITLNTALFGCEDRTVFEGTEDEMKFLCLVAACYAYVSSESEIRKVVVDKVISEFDSMPEGVRGVPLFIVNLMPQFIGKRYAKAALAMAAGISAEDLARTEPFRVAELSLDFLVEFVLFCHESGKPVQQAMAELGKYTLWNSRQASQFCSETCSPLMGIVKGLDKLDLSKISKDDVKAAIKLQRECPDLDLKQLLAEMELLP